MSIRQTTSVVLVAAALTATGLLSSVSAQEWVTPLTAWGHPDLQGNWSNATLTPFERRRGQGLIMTSEEVERLEGRAEAQIRSWAQPSDPNRPPPEVTGFIGRSYNQVYYDRGDRVAMVNGEPPGLAHQLSG